MRKDITKRGGLRIIILTYASNVSNGVGEFPWYPNPNKGLRDFLRNNINSK